MILRIVPLLLFAAISLFAPVIAVAQNSSEELQYRKWRVTLLPPLSTNGVDAPNYTARYSVNLLGGYHGGLDGAEIGGLVNYTKYYTEGIQIAGLGNITNGSMAGLNIAGLGNIAKGDISGLQLAGALNLAANNSNGLQLAGLGNFAAGDLEGLQGAGIINASWGSISGLQIAGIANFAHKDVEGLQITGIMNVALADISGLQISGVANTALKNTEGLMITGGLNMGLENAGGLMVAGGLNYAKNLEGISISGGANIARNLKGLQFAGLLNASESAKGVQIGLVNIAREFEGVPIGFISYYGNGRKNIDARFSDGGFTDIGITLGTHHVYNSALFGYNTLLNRNVYRIGLAVGLEKNIQDSFERWRDETMYVNQEFAVTHQFENEWSGDLNLIYSYKFMVGKRFSDGFSVYGGPSLNAQITRVDGANDYTWYSLWSPERNGREYRFWVGFTTGVRFFKQKAPERLRNEFVNR